MSEHDEWLASLPWYERQRYRMVKATGRCRGCNTIEHVSRVKGHLWLCDGCLKSYLERKASASRLCLACEADEILWLSANVGVFCSDVCQDAFNRAKGSSDE